MNKKKIIWALIILAIVFALVYAYREYTRTHKDLAGVKADLAVESGILISEFEKNDSAANKKYLGKILDISGVVKEIDTAAGGIYTIVLGHPGSKSSVRCQLDSIHASDAAKLSSGSSVLMRGACTGFEKNELLGENLGSDVHLNRCVVVSIKNN